MSIILGIFLAGAAYADVHVSSIARVYDGDTITVNIDQWPPIVGQAISIRVRGVDTPEIRGKCQAEKDLARRAKSYTAAAVKYGQVTLKNLERGKYFRIVADVEVNGKPLAAALISQGLGRPYDGGKRKGWC